MARKQIRVLSSPDYSFFTRGGAVVYTAYPFAVAVGTKNKVREVEIYNAPLISGSDHSLGETTLFKTVKVGDVAPHYAFGKEAAAGEVVSITQRSVTLCPVGDVPRERAWLIDANGTMQLSMAEFCLAQKHYDEQNA